MVPSIVFGSVPIVDAAKITLLSVPVPANGTQLQNSLLVRGGGHGLEAKEVHDFRS
ncbi:hypothetical protein LAV79_15320 [Peribacillus butanolivorans]|uniref:hypothetical protein n=1 Tax=Peribacillus butanolivorans TaxID=421767 RepID=UPI0030C913FA